MCVDKYDVQNMIHNGFEKLQKHLDYRFQLGRVQANAIKAELGGDIRRLSTKQDEMNGKVTKQEERMQKVETFTAVMEEAHTDSGRLSNCPNGQIIRELQDYVMRKEASERLEKERAQDELEKEKLKQGKIQNLFHKKNYRIGLFVAILSLIAFLVGRFWEAFIEQLGIFGQ